MLIALSLKTAIPLARVIPTRRGTLVFNGDMDLIGWFYRLTDGALVAFSYKGNLGAFTTAREAVAAIAPREKTRFS